MTTLNDIDILIKVAAVQTERRDRRARRLLSLYMAGRKPNNKLIDTYTIMCECATRCNNDIDMVLETQAMAASV